MAKITRNQYGGITINNRVLIKLIVGDILEMNDVILLCTRKGKLIKHKPTPFIDPDYYDSIELSEIRNSIKIKVYAVAISGNTLSEIADDVSDKIENIFAAVGLDKPASITVSFRGIKDDEISKRNIDLTRNND